MSEQKKHISVEVQYVKDLSFENPSAPASLTRTKSVPQIDLSLDIEVQRLDDNNVYEVILDISVTTIAIGRWSAVKDEVLELTTPAELSST